MKSNVLIVDDENIARQSLTDILKLEGYNVAAVPGGQAAVEYVRTHPVDLMIVDLRMPGMDGLDAFRRIRSADQNARGLLISAFATDEVMRCAEDLGMDALLSKPLDLPVLLSRISQILSHN